MTQDPFEMSEPAVHSVDQGDVWTCPCGAQSQVLHTGRKAARADLDRHMRQVHPERTWPR